MIARDRLMNAMAAAFTDAELASMQSAVAHELASRAQEKARKAATTALPAPSASAAPAPAAPKHASGFHRKAG